jgi:hypothetical protein
MLALLRRGFWRLPRKSGDPPLFELSLKVQRDRAHYLPPGSRSCPGTTASTRSALKRSQMVPRGISVGRTCDGNDRPAKTPSPQPEPAPAGFLESGRGFGPASRRASLWQRAYDHVLNNGTISSIVQFDVRAPKDAGCNASRDKGLHLEILVSRNDRREFDS